MSLIWVALAGAIDVGLRALVPMGNWHPDIMLASILYIALRRPLGEAFLLAFVFGLVWDITFLEPLGMHAFLFILAVMIASRLNAILWADYAISRFVIGFVLCGMVRFGEVIFWLSNLRYEVPFSLPQSYVLMGAVTTGIVFALIPWRTSPIQLSKPSPQVLFGE